MPALRPRKEALVTPDPTKGLPEDLARVLRDPSIIVPQDQAVFEMVAKAQTAPSDTMGAWGIEEWREAWIEARKESIRWQRNYSLLLESVLALHGRVNDLFKDVTQSVTEIEAALDKGRQNAIVHPVA